MNSDFSLDAKLFLCCRMMITATAAKGDEHQLVQLSVLRFYPSFPILPSTPPLPFIVTALWISHTLQLGLISITWHLFSIPQSEQGGDTS